VRKKLNCGIVEVRVCPERNREVQIIGRSLLRRHVLFDMKKKVMIKGRRDTCAFFCFFTCIGLSDKAVPPEPSGFFCYLLVICMWELRMISN
jgi:hypothetical protein